MPGPFSVAANAKDLIGRASTWNKEFSLLFIDNPVGVGFSFTQSTAGFVRDEYHVGRDLYSFITQFFTVFDQYAKNDFYIAGESYAGTRLFIISLKTLNKCRSELPNFINFIFSF